MSGGELVKAVMVDTSIQARWCVYTADTFSVAQNQTVQDVSTGVSFAVDTSTYFLVQKIAITGFYNALSGGGHRVQQQPDFFIGLCDIFDPKSGKSYVQPPYNPSGTGGVPNTFFPPALNNTPDLEDYILLKGGERLGFRLNVMASSPGTGGAWVRFTGTFSGVEFLTSNPVDIVAIEQLATQYMPPDAAPPKALAPGGKTPLSKPIVSQSPVTTASGNVVSPIDIQIANANAQLAALNLSLTQLTNQIAMQKTLNIKNDPVLANLNVQHATVASNIANLKAQITQLQAQKTASGSTSQT